MSDREKISFSERDKRQRGRKGGSDGSRGDKSQRRSRNTTAMYRRKMDERLFGKKADRGRIRLADRLREAHGGPNFHRTFREYLKAHGLPEDIALLMLLLDLDDESDVVRILEGIGETLGSMSPEDKSLLRSRLRNLEMSTAFDAVADAAERLLARI